MTRLIKCVGLGLSRLNHFFSAVNSVHQWGSWYPLWMSRASSIKFHSCHTICSFSILWGYGAKCWATDIEFDYFVVSHVHRDGIQQRRNSWQDGVYGTNCPIRPGKNFTYVLQVKDQIGSYFYFPSFGFQKAAGGFGGIRIWSRPGIPVPFPPPAGDFTILAGDWFKREQHVSRGTRSLVSFHFLGLQDLFP